MYTIKVDGEKERDAIRECRAQALDHGNPDKITEAPTGLFTMGHQETLSTAMGIIYLYLRVCYTMGDNPLRYLRKYFPKFRWNTMKISGKNEFVSTVAMTNYTWMVYCAGSFVGEVVIATRLGGGKNEKILYTGKEDLMTYQLLLHTDSPLHKALKAAGCRIMTADGLV